MGEKETRWETATPKQVIPGIEQAAKSPSDEKCCTACGRSISVLAPLSETIFAKWVIPLLPQGVPVLMEQGPPIKLCPKCQERLEEILDLLRERKMHHIFIMAQAIDPDTMYYKGKPLYQLITLPNGVVTADPYVGRVDPNDILLDPEVHGVFEVKDPG